MKSILISIKPKYVADILNRRKTIEIRKTAPKRDLPIDVYIYCTKGDYIGHLSNRYVGKVVAKFRLSQIVDIDEVEDWIVSNSCVSKESIESYRGDGSAYAWHISDLAIFDEPKELDEFGLKKAPLSWRYVEEKRTDDRNEAIRKEKTK